MDTPRQVTVVSQPQQAAAPPLLTPAGWSAMTTGGTITALAPELQPPSSLQQSAMLELAAERRRCQALLEQNRTLQQVVVRQQVQVSRKHQQQEPGGLSTPVPSSVSFTPTTSTPAATSAQRAARRQRRSAQRGLAKQERITSRENQSVNLGPRRIKVLAETNDENRRPLGSLGNRRR
jgi:hypothetical protein